MRRSDFLALTGLSVANYQNLIRRDLLPLADEPSDGGWRVYAAKDVVLTALALELARVGIDQSDASSVVVIDHGDIGKWLDVAVRQIEDEGAVPDIFYHVARLHWTDGAAELSKRVGFAAPLSAIVKARIRISRERSVIFGDVAATVDQIVSVNLTGVMRAVRRRAKEAGVDYDTFAAALAALPPRNEVPG